jgi:hypothetical protein
MLGTLIGFVILLVLLGFGWWVVQQLLGLIPLAEPFATLVRIALYVILVVIVIYVLITLLGMVGIHVPLFGVGHFR